MKKLVCMLLAAVMLCAAAMADVVTTGSVNLRDAANRNGKILFSVPADTHLEFLGGVLADERGVIWYQVRYKDTACWVSSMFSELQDQIGNGVELSSYYGKDLYACAMELGLGDFRYNEYSEVPNEYYDEALSLYGNAATESMVLHGTGYTLFDASVGMEIYVVAKMYAERGLDLTYTNDGVYVFEHKGKPAWGDGKYDSCVNVYFDGNGYVYEFDWSTYTG